MHLDNNVFYTTVTLMPGVPLNVYALRGKEYSILIDTGIKAMKDQILELCNETNNIKNVLITHVHADHIGCNTAVKTLTNAQFFAAGAVPWIEDMETHYQEFCIPSEHLPDSPQQREEILGLMDGPVQVDAVITDGTIFRAGDNIELETVALPGHKLEEVGYFNHSTGDFFTGDILLALAAPFFHGFQSARAFRNSLQRIRKLVNDGYIRRMFAAHHPPLDKNNALKAVKVTEDFLDQVEHAVISESMGIEFPQLWKNVCDRMNKQYEFRGYAMLEVQVKELIEDGVLCSENGLIYKR